jgi:hypothetical protein
MMGLPDLLAQSSQGPVHLFTGEPTAPTHPILPIWLGLILIGAVITVALFIWFLIDRAERIDRDPAEYAFRAMARRLHTPQRHADLLRRLANCAHTTPVALLVSDHALRAAALCYEQTNPPKRDKAALKQLLA